MDAAPGKQAIGFMKRWDEQAIVGEILAGDVNAYAILVKRYQTPIFNLMMRMTRSQEDACDLTQDTFLRAYEKLERFNGRHAFFPWLYSIGLNLVRDHLRRKKVREAGNDRLRFSATAGDQTPGPLDALVNTLEARRVRAAAMELPWEYREALVLRFHEGLPVKQVASALGISESGAKMRIHRALRALKKQLVA